MDTGTHIAMGVALGGLATLDPVVSNDPVLFNAVMVGTIAGSFAPDFDTILKMKNNAAYLRHHRGITHSVPAIILWGIIISGIIYAFSPEINFFHLWIWTFIAVCLHVLVDLTNAYGTQFLYPFSNKWFAYGFIHTFDSYIFLMHIIGIIAWILGAKPGYLWVLIYLIISLYFINRYLNKREIIKKVHKFLPYVENIAISPTIKQSYWRLAITTKDYLYVGIVKNGQIQIIDQFRKKPLPDNPMFEIAKTDKNIAAFLSFSPIYHWQMNVHDHVTEIRFIDLRYRAKEYYTFVAVVYISNKNKEIISSYTGWIFSEQKLQKKLSFDNLPM